MFRFEIASILWWLILVPLLLLLFHFILQQRKNALGKAGDYNLISRLFPNWSMRKEWLKSTLLLLGLALMLVAWANPQWGNRKQKVKVKSSDVVIALDISQSMLANDISPNRMERAKFFLSELIKKLRGERIGLIYFAGSAYLQMPLTSDYASAETFIKSASPTQAGTQGTVIADAIELSASIFGDENPTQKALIIISDGENHESEAIAAAQEAKENGVSVFTLGIGTQEGSTIPVMERGRKVLKKDLSGNPVVSSLNVDILEQIASSGGGEFYMIDQTMSALNKLDVAIDKLEKKEVEQRSFTDFNSYFQYFLFLSTILFILEYFINNKKVDKSRFKKWIGVE